jgi:hypothetical protein
LIARRAYSQQQQKEAPMAPKIKLSFPGFGNIVPTPSGTFVNVTFKSTNPVLPAVSVGFGKPKMHTPTGLDFEENQLIATTIPLLMGVRPDHDVIVQPLPPNSDLYLVIKGKDHINAVKKFKTKRRRLDVHFGKILMNDDSDDLSDGDFKFGFFVDNNNAPQGTSLRFPGNGSEISIGTGKTKTIDVNATVFDADSLSLSATGVDNDDDPSPGLDTEGIPSATNPDVGSGSNGGWEWVTGFQTVLVDFTGQEEARTVPFIINAWQHNVDLHFQVTGTVKISYV